MSSETNSYELIPSPYFTSGFESASLFSSDAQTAFLSGNLFSEVLIPTPVPAHIGLPEYYTADQSRPPTPNFADYPLRVDRITIYDPQNDPRFSILSERFITNTDLLSHKRKETELKRLQTPNLDLKFEVKDKFQGLNPHPKFHVSKIEHKTSPAPFEVVHIEFEQDLNLSTITYGEITFVTHSPVLNILPLSKLYTTFYIANLILYLHLFNFTFSIPITPSDTENFLPSDDPIITNLMVSHYDCAKQHNLRQFNLLNVKQCTEAPSDIHHASHHTYRRDSRSYCSPYRSSYRSPHRHNSRPRYRSRSYSRDNNLTKNTNSFRPPSSPRESRFSRTRSHSNPRNKVNMIQPQHQFDPIKIEVHM